MKLHHFYLLLAFLSTVLPVLIASTLPLEHWLNRPSLWGVWGLLPNIFAPMAIIPFIFLVMAMEVDSNEY